MHRFRHSLTLAFLLLFFCFGAHTASAQKKHIETAIIKTAIYCDHCKQCESCGDKFNKDLYNEKGIKSVEIDTKAMTVTVIYDTRKIDLATIRRFISKLGYDADEIKADPEALAKLDGCCKK